MRLPASLFTLTKTLFMACFSLFFISACATNPVTGKKELSLTPSSQEIAIGEQHYQPSLQSQGGEYTLEPELSTYIRVVGERIAAKSDRPELPWEFVILNNSVANAWALPGGKIALNRGLLLELQSEAELAAVLGHEIVHAAARHGAQKMDQGMLMGAGIQILDISLANHDQHDLMLGASALGMQLIQSRYGRNQELEADAYGMEYMSKAGYDPSGAVDLQRTFLRLSQGKQPPLWQQLFATHPPSRERLDANINKATELPAGDIGREYYQLKTSQLRKNNSAYQQADKGRQALARGDAKQALQLAEKAINLLPQESHFLQLKAESLQQLGDRDAALNTYNQAIKLNSRYYGHFLGRGLLLQQLGQNTQALADLTTSQQLLPTATASYAQGQLAMARGDQRGARNYYTQAAQSPGTAGEAARVALLRIELAQNPDRYIVPSLFINSQGYLAIRIKNLATVAVQQIKIVVEDDQQRQILEYPDKLLAGQTSAVINSHFKPNQQQLQGFRVSITAAALAE